MGVGGIELRKLEKRTKYISIELAKSLKGF